MNESMNHPADLYAQCADLLIILPFRMYHLQDQTAQMR